MEEKAEWIRNRK